MSSIELTRIGWRYNSNILLATREYYLFFNSSNEFILNVFIRILVDG